MIIKTVQRPSQDDNTIPLEREYENETWCVKTHMYRDKKGGMKCWFDYLKQLENKGCNFVYLYDIKAMRQKIANGESGGKIKWKYETLYYVRADYKK